MSDLFDALCEAICRTLDRIEDEDIYHDSVVGEDIISPEELAKLRAETRC